MTKIPEVKIGLIGGSGTWGARIPEDLNRDDAVVEQYYNNGFETDFGQTGPVKLLQIDGEPVLRFAMHNWHMEQGGPVPPWTCAKQIAWVFHEAGVEWALVEGSVGGVQSPDKPGEPLPPWSVTITDDLLMYWFPPDLPFYIGKEFFPRMREPFCAGLRKVLLVEALKEECFTVYDHGVYACTPPGRFETPAEIQMLRSWGAHIVGQSLGHEAPLMKKLGIHFASMNIVSNHAEGYSEWVEGGMVNFYQQCPVPVGNVIIDTAKEVIANGLGECDCHREEYLLKGLDVFPVEGA